MEVHVMEIECPPPLFSLSLWSVCVFGWVTTAVQFTFVFSNCSPGDSGPTVPHNHGFYRLQVLSPRLLDTGGCGHNGFAAGLCQQAQVLGTITARIHRTPYIYIQVLRIADLQHSTCARASSIIQYCRERMLAYYTFGRG
jgi:hypothetical protein